MSANIRTKTEPLIIEFIGTPGAGKTSLLPVVSDYLNQRGVNAYTVLEAARRFAQRTLLGEITNQLAPARLRGPLLWQVFYQFSLLYRLRFFREHRRLIRHVRRHQRRRPIPAEERRHASQWFFCLAGYYEFLKAHGWRDEVLVLDEGFLHRVVQLHASEAEEPDPAKVFAYVDLIPRPDLVVFVKAPWQVCEERVYRRGLWERFRHKSRSSQVSRYIANSDRVVNLAIDHIKSNGWTLIEVENGSDDPSEAKTQLQHKLAETLAVSSLKGKPLATAPARGVHRSTQLRILRLPRPSRLSSYLKSSLRPLDIPIDTICEVLESYQLELASPPANLPIGRRGRNVGVPTSAGRKVLKLYRLQWSEQTVLYGHSILNRLAQLGFPAPCLVATRDAHTFVSKDGNQYALFDFLEGINYSSSFLMRAHRLKLVALAGRTLACLHWQLRGFVPEGEHHLGFRSYTDGPRRAVAWYSEKVEELKDKSRGLSTDGDKAHADWLVHNCDRILEELSLQEQILSAAALPRLIIHGDYGLHNVLFQGMDTVIPVDFELARLEWRLSDVVSCLSRFRYGQKAYDFESMCHFMDAYGAEFPLSSEEWQLLPMVWRFYKLRAALNYWNSYFETAGPTRKLISARDAVSQAEWALTHRTELHRLSPLAHRSLVPGSIDLGTSSKLAESR